MSEILGLELDTYKKHREALLKAAEGSFVVISRDKILGVFESQSDAIRQGYDQLGNVPFLVKQVLEVEEVHGFVSNLLAV